MSAYYEIHKACTQSVIDLALGLPIAYENSNFNPESNGGDQYLDLTILYNNQEPVNKTSMDDVTGILQITNYSKSGESVKKTYELIDKLRANYTHAKQIPYGDKKTMVNSSGKYCAGQQVVNVQNMSVTKRGNIDGWFVTVVSIFFWSDISR